MLIPRSCLYASNVVKAFNRDILSLLTNSKFRDTYRENILYIDPPYNERQYGPNYHIYETLIRYDDPVIKGKTGLRDWKNESKSRFVRSKPVRLYQEDCGGSSRQQHLH